MGNRLSFGTILFINISYKNGIPLLFYPLHGVRNHSSSTN